ncbi:MAG: hypothetical protein JWQ98_1858 [Chlorobi bacterium]|nr:hypothetical protein [Chlorobiota bacterium]
METAENESNRDKDMKDGSKADRAPSREERRAEEVADANNELDTRLGHDIREGGIDADQELLGDPADSLDEHMPANSESIEDKVQDILNSGIFRQ